MGNISSENVLYDGVNVVRQLHGNANPTAGAGVTAELGSIYQQTDGTVWAKTSAPDTGWTALGGGGGSNNHQTATVIVGNADAGDTAADCDYLWTVAGDTAIQDAIDLLSGGDGGYVHLKRGYYDMSGGATIQIPDGVILQGDGMASTTIYNELGTPVLQVATGGTPNVTVRDLTIESDSAVSTGITDAGFMLFERVTWRQIAGGEANLEISTSGITSLYHIVFLNCIFERVAGGECVVINTDGLGNPSLRFINCEFLGAQICIRTVNVAEISMISCSLRTTQDSPIVIQAGGSTILNVDDFRVSGVHTGTCRFLLEGTYFASNLTHMMFDGATRLVQDATALTDVNFSDIWVGSVTEWLVSAGTYIDVTFSKVIVEDLFDAGSPGGFLFAGSSVLGLRVDSCKAQYNSNAAFSFSEGVGRWYLLNSSIDYNVAYGAAAHAIYVVPDVLDNQLGDVHIHNNTFMVGASNALLVTEPGSGGSSAGTGPFWFTENHVIGAETGVPTEAFLLLQGDAMLQGIHIEGNQFFGNRTVVLFNPLTSPIVSISIADNDFTTNAAPTNAAYPATLRVNGAGTTLREISVAQNRWQNAYGPAVEFTGIDGYENVSVKGNKYADNWGIGGSQVLIEYWMRFGIDGGFASLEIADNKLFNNSGVQQNVTVFDFVALDSIAPGLTIVGNYAKFLDPTRAAIDFNGQDVTGGIIAKNQMDEVTGFITRTTLVFSTVQGNVCTGLELGVEGNDALILDHCSVSGNVFQASAGTATGLLVRAGAVNNVFCTNIFSGYATDVELQVGADDNIVAGNQAPTIVDNGTGNSVAMNI